MVCDTTNARSGYGAKASEVVKCSTDEEVIDSVIEQVQEHDLVFARLMDLATLQGCMYDSLSFWIRLMIREWNIWTG